MSEIARKMGTDELVQEFAGIIRLAGSRGYFAMAERDQETLQVLREEFTQRLNKTASAVDQKDTERMRTPTCYLNEDEEGAPHQDTLQRVCGQCGEGYTVADVDELSAVNVNLR